MATELTIQLHSPHAKQRAFRNSRAKRKVIVAGRRGGKTTGVVDIAIEAMLKGRRVLEAAPTADQTNVFWEACKEALAEPIRANIIEKNESERVLKMPSSVGGGRIRTKTAWDADTLRGDYADLLIMDEFSLMKPSVWDEVGAPMLLDNDGDAVFIFTPKRKNHAHAMYVRALQDDTGRWGAFHFTSHDNPHLSKAALAELTADMTEDAYRQEIMAEFLDNEGAVFRNIGACLHAPMDTSPAEHPRHRMVMGVDWAKQSDYTAMSVFCCDCGQEVSRDRSNQIDYTFQRKRLVAMVQRWGVRRLIPEQNSIGEPILEELQRDPALRGVSVEGFMTTASSKPPLIESLALAFEGEEAQWQDDPVWTAELESYERRVNPNTNRSSYNAPEGVHDDTVIARALAWQAAIQVPEQHYIETLAEPVDISPF